jgi:hypothetical protein
MNNMGNFWNYPLAAQVVTSDCGLNKDPVSNRSTYFQLPHILDQKSQSKRLAFY